MKKTKIVKELYKKQDLVYKEFSIKLNPVLNSDIFIGVRTPELKKMAKEIGYDKEFLSALPHFFFEENQLHAYILNGIKDYDLAIKELDIFLPYVDNWATCDSIKIKCFNKHKDELIKRIKRWLKSKDEYTVRYGINALMTYYLGEDLKVEYLKDVANVKYDTYYVNMMRAWYFATALAKNYEETIDFLEKNKIDEWTLKKTISKAHDSYRISKKQEERIDRLFI